MAYKIPIGCNSLDELLKGGIESGTITSLYGEAGSGKTNMCLVLAYNVCLNGRKTIYIDTEGVSLARLKQISGENFEKIHRNILFFTPYTLEEQEKNVEDSIRLVEKNADIGLIVVDSATVHYRATFGEDNEVNGRQSLSRQVIMLLQLARKRDIPVVLTTQVYTDSERNTFMPIGGHSLNHNAKTVVKLERVGQGQRRAIVKKSRHLPEENKAEFFLTDKGIECPN
jgi:DNA repair protein RadB